MGSIGRIDQTHLRTGRLTDDEWPRLTEAIEKLRKYVVVLPDQLDASTEKEFFAVFEKGRKKRGVDLGKDSGRPAAAMHNEL